jgi:hypothetical protein
LANHSKDNRHSPQDVLRGVLARTVPTPTLARIFFSTQFTRYLDRSGYIRFRRWRFYAEAGLARQEVQIHIYTSTLKVEYEETELAKSLWHHLPEEQGTALFPPLARKRLFSPILIVSPSALRHTVSLDDFFWRAFPYTRIEATQLWHTCGELSSLRKAHPSYWCSLEHTVLSTEAHLSPR